MKNTVRIFALVLVLVMSITCLVSCSTYGSIKKAFEKEGYTLQNADNEPTGEIETDDGVITYTIHTFQKESEKGEGILDNIVGGITEGLSTAVVWEFSSDKDLNKALEESETLKGIVKDAQNSDYVNGNCVLTTINPKAVEIFKGTK